VDTFGIPILRVHMTWSDNERAMMKDMAATAAEMLEAAGAKNVQSGVHPNPVPGWGIHEVGIARMGDDPKTSVLTQFCRTHDVGNLYVMDGSCFVSIGCQNPTLTIMAIAARSTDHLLEEMRKGNV
jgi:glucoside 3-dehydrogenase (cytochrome c) catalytic subunit